MGYSFWLTARGLLYAPPHRQDSTYYNLCYPSQGALAKTRNSSMGPLWRIDPTTHRTTELHLSPPNRTRSDYLQPGLLISSVHFHIDWQHGMMSCSVITLVRRLHQWFVYIGFWLQGARSSSVVRAFAHGAMGRRIDPSWGGPIELFLVPASAPWLV